MEDSRLTGLTDDRALDTSWDLSWSWNWSCKVINYLGLSIGHRHVAAWEVGWIGIKIGLTMRRGEEAAGPKSTVPGDGTTELGCHRHYAGRVMIGTELQ